MYDFAQDIGIRNLVKILHIFTTLQSRPPFSTEKKNLEQGSSNSPFEV
jgi:hypothetical protein